MDRQQNRKECDSLRRKFIASVVAVGVFLAATPVAAQPQPPVPGSEFYETVGDGYRKVEMAVGTSRVLRFGYDIPRVFVNDGIVTAKPISPNEIMLQGMRPGMASLYVHDANNNVQTIDIVVLTDVRPLEDALESLFPSSRISIRPLNSTVVVTGHASSSEQTQQIMEVVRDFFPTPINHIRVDGNHTVLLTAKVFEVSRTKLKRAGIDWAAVMQGDFVISNPGNSVGLDSFFEDGIVSGQSTIMGGIVDNGNQFTFLLDLLEQDNMAKVLADTQLVADSGRAASLLSGGRIPIPVSNGLATSIQFQEFGTSLDCVPIVLEDGQIRLEILAEVSDVAGDSRDSVTGTPGFRTRSVNTAVTVPAGKTIAIAGIIQNRVDSEVRGIPYLKDMPWVGSLFRRTLQNFNEVDLVVVIRPEFVGAVDPCEMPEGPGRSTVAPGSYDMYIRGHLEVPSCDPLNELGPIAPFDSGFGSGFGSGIGSGGYGEQGYGEQGYREQGMLLQTEEGPMNVLPVPLGPSNGPQPLEPMIPARGASRSIRVEKLPESPAGSVPTSRRSQSLPHEEASYPGDAGPALMGPMGYDGVDVSMRPLRQR